MSEYYTAEIVVRRVVPESVKIDRYNNEKTKTERTVVVATEVKVSSELLTRMKSRLVKHIELLDEDDFAGEGVTE